VISREDFIFTIGYDGNTAIVDGKSKRMHGHLDTEELAEKGLFKPALCSALYANDEPGMRSVLELYNKLADRPLPSVDHLKRTFGISEVTTDITKVLLC
jgi:hypothetical protein